ncbi:CynX/NimT family MFS transporter [Microbacterium pygmaeum]|uniref:MFS transporter, CP family, cyanate transporter n=1 Tax=Microbacterium pygmaeum TaxID=370764 RepID=A0A1G7VCT5_9MICO|nr:MFS transporter [Microbacterium pygmaeum]SDG57159.1 MFS transporter, CP family, cyanate transporter [Microbacterium pygmaeum]
MAVLLIALNLRPTITGVGPLLSQISATLGTTEAALGALAAVPLIAFAVISPLAHGLSARFGIPRTVLCSLLLLGVGTIVRSVPGSAANLWVGTALLGASIAIVNVLMPAVIKRDFPDRVPVMTAVFTACLSGMGAVASGVVVPISHIQVNGVPLGWQAALLWTGALLPFALVAWALSMRRQPRHEKPSERGRASGIWRDRLAWQVLLYMGLQSMTFYMLVTWFAPIAQSLGRSEVVAGFDVMIYQIFCFGGSLIVPLVLRGRFGRFAAAAVPALTLVGIAGLIVLPQLFTVWAVVCGIGCGAALGMSLSLFSLRARTHQAAGALSGMAQSGGYLIAATGPILFGALVTLTGGWLASLVLVALVLAGQLLTGLFVGRDRFVLEQR